VGFSATVAQTPATAISMTPQTASKHTNPTMQPRCTLSGTRKKRGDANELEMMIEML
jgi:hypothetical protein